MNRIPYLDGLRGIAIILVLFGHAKNTIPYFNGTIKTILANSHLGVMIFFVLSGYLITKLLLHEYSKKNSISIKKFYLRRSLRIFPIYYLYLLVLAFGTYALEVINIPFSYLWTTGLYLSNYRPLFIHENISVDNYALIGHFWTLALEEQYYLIWPSVLYLCGITRSKRFLPFILGVYPILRIASYFLFPDYRGQIGIMLHTMGDSILWGCYAALIEKYHPDFTNSLLHKVERFKIAPWLAIALLFVIFPLVPSKFSGSFYMTIGFSLEGVIISTFLLYILNAKPASFEFLNNRYLSWIGTLSYSIYVWHMLFLEHDNILNLFPFSIIVIFITAYCSYTFVEKPILSLKDKFNAY